MWDAITDPLVGFLTTRTNTRWGSLKPWIFAGMWPLALTYLAMFTVPAGLYGNGQDDSRMGYVFAMYLLYQMGISMYHVPYTSLTVHLSDEPAERDSATMYRMIFETLATLLGSFQLKFMNGVGLDLQGNGTANDDDPADDGGSAQDRANRNAFTYAAFIAAGIILLSGTAVLSGISEQKGLVPPPRISFFKGVMTVATSKAYVILSVMFLWVWMSVAMVQSNLILYLQFSFDRSNPRLAFAAEDFLVTLIGTTVVSMFVWAAVMGCIGKKRTYQIGLFMVAGCLVSLALLPEDTTELAFHLLMAGLGFSLGAVYLVPVAMLPDVIDEATIECGGVRREALYYSYFVFAQKFAAGIAIALSTAILGSWGGYESGIPPAEQPETVGPVLRFIEGWVGGLLVVISLFFSFFYPITAEMEQQNKQTLARMRQEAAAEFKSDQQVLTNSYSSSSDEHTHLI